MTDILNPRLDPSATVIQWRAIIAGTLISLLVYFILMSLGVAIGADEIRDLGISGDGAENLSTNAGLWFVFTVVISLGLGSYASSRVSGLIATRVGFVQGGVIAALFFTLMITQAGSALSWLGSSINSIKDVVGGIAAQSLSHQRVSSVVEDALSDLNFKQSPETIAAGVIKRLMRGNPDSAAVYLATQAGISRDTARARLQTLSQQIRTTSAQIAAKSADAARSIGLAVFATMLLGSLCAMFSGAAGAQRSIRQPISRMDRRALKMQRPVYS